MKFQILISLFFLSTRLLAQLPGGSSISVGIMPGYLLAHTPTLKNLESHIFALESQIEFGQSHKEWAENYKHPVTGFGFNYFNFGREETGWAVSLQGTVKFNVVYFRKNALAVRFGAGVGYLSEMFDPETNLRNQAIGSHFNGFMQTAFMFEHPMARSDFSAGLVLSHFSNGAFSMPNLGVNLPSLYIKYARDIELPSKSSEKSVDRDWIIQDLGWNYSLTILATHKERTLANPVQFNLFGLQARALYTRHIKYSYRMGSDLMFDKTYAYVRDIEINLDSIPLFSQPELGLVFGISWNMGRMQISWEVGRYILRPGVYKRKSYNRISLDYRFSRSFGFHTALKFHRAVADYFEWGLTYHFK